MYIGALLTIEACVVLLRSLSRGIRHAQLTRVHDVVNIQLVMIIVSSMMFKRTNSVFAGLSGYARDAARAFILLFILMSHSAWVFFYVYLPDDSIISVVCFVCLAAYLHAACFLLFMVAVEFFSTPIKFRAQLPGFIRSKNTRTVLSFFFAFMLTAVGLAATHFSPVVRRVDVSVMNLPPSMDGFSIALLTDLHVGPTVRRQRVAEIVSIVNSLHADAVAISGDLVDGFIPNIGSHALPLAKLQSKYGTFFATGNHEYYHGNVDDWLGFFSSHLNMTLLRNNHKKLYTSENDYLCMAGVDDYFTEKLHLPHHRMDAKQALDGCEPSAPTVLLVHQPNGARKIIRSMADTRIDLILSGHTHGGQFYVFWPFAYFKNAYLQGLYQMKKSRTQIYVSPGVNYWGPPVKMNNLCEITLVRLRSGS